MMYRREERVAYLTIEDFLSEELLIYSYVENVAKAMVLPKMEVRSPANEIDLGGLRISQDHKG
jgi:hypothetical protein